MVIRLCSYVHEFLRTKFYMLTSNDLLFISIKHKIKCMSIFSPIVLLLIYIIKE
jgi:hypothetical protein